MECIKNIEDYSFDWYLKKQIPIKAVQINEEFLVETITGEKVKGRAGDYLCKDSKGYLYPCAKEVFEESYDKIDNEESFE